ncbi:hypothetical protein [Haloferula sp. BvORR071]|uniref:hypothetical protein n=1 Tax=Haloferula sp. BvORR071 TaxID=1396141 RepID=UPI0005563CB8|nr:hypothetical protein [Haloferula sp. BvORR071]
MRGSWLAASGALGEFEDEVFTWGEGKDAELLEIKAGDVRGLRTNVSLVLTQSQNLQRLEAAKTAIQIALQYVAVPEADKPALRRLFVQALSSMGFNDADRIIRKAVEAVPDGGIGDAGMAGDAPVTGAEAGWNGEGIAGAAASGAL